MDGVKEYIISKRFSILSYICVVIHLHCGVIFTAITTSLRLSEMERFNCAVDTRYATHKSYVEKTCFSIYDNEYNSPVKFSAFVPFNFGSVVVVSVVYSLAVGNRIEDAVRLSGRSDEPQTVARGNNEQGRKTFYVFNFYMFHLVARSMLCILFTILQHTVLYPSGYDSQFSCVYRELRSVDPNMTPANNGSANLSSVECTNSAAKDKQFWLTIVSVCNGIFAVIALAEIVYLLKKRFFRLTPQSSTWSCDLRFINEHFLRKRYVPNSCDIYKQKVMKFFLTPDINYGSNNTSLDMMFIDVVIHSGQAPLKFSKDMTRHEIYDVYMKVPEKSIHLKQIKDLFYANKDTNYNVPSTILVIGRPGIGKTVLTRKIMYDWAKDDDKIYHNRVAFYFKFREFNFREMKDITIKKFLQFGTELNEDEFEGVFEKIWKNPQNAIFIFDGLDEFGADVKNIQNVLAQSKKYSSNDISCQMSALSFFVKILSGEMLPGATVLVTSRPIVNDVLCKLHFGRTVEIIGFTSDKIEQYVKQFCANHNRCDLEATMLSHIKSSSEVKNLCYIPVNCFIVCVTLFKCLIYSKSDIGALPTTLTELYQLALVYFNKHHDRNQSKEVLKELQQLAFNGMKNDELIFNEELVDAKMKASGLLNSLPNPIFQIQIQVCFIHLTIQEFLAAKHIVETKTPEEVKEFISSHIKHGRWHLVLQFLAGLLAVKMRTSDDSHEYRSCVWSFKNYLDIQGTRCEIRPNHILVMKCLREAQNENIAREIATSILKDVTEISCPYHEASLLSSSDVTAVVFLCKHMKILNSIDVKYLSSLDCSLELLKLLQGRCMKSLNIVGCHLGDLGLERLGALLKSGCLVNHECFNLTTLNLGRNTITAAGMAHVLDNQVYNQLTDLDLSYNPIRDEGVNVLCISMQEKCLNLETLNLASCSLTSESVPWLVKFLKNEHCGLRTLKLSSNDIKNEGLLALCNVLGNEICNLTELTLSSCSLTERCMSTLCRALDEEHCGLKTLNLSSNDIKDEGLDILCNVIGKETCNLTELHLSGCFLTKNCKSALIRALADEEHCTLEVLNLGFNDLGDESVRELCDVLQTRNCHLTRLTISGCSLTDECIPILCRALGDERCTLTNLDVSYNGFTDKHLSLLVNTLKLRSCCLRRLNIGRNKITEKGVRLLKETSETLIDIVV